MNTVFTKVPKTLGISDFRAGLAKNFAKAKKAPLIISGRKGDESFVLLSATTYNKMVEAWEDEQDGKELAQLIKEQKGKKFYPFKPTIR